MTLRFGSVCSGIEAASVAWHPLGWQAAWLSEIEPFPSAVLKYHYANVLNLGDMTKLPDRILSGEIEAPDLLCGGTPCQAFSVAGLRKSLDDARGNLSLTFCEIANAIDNVRATGGSPPAIVFWENVPGVLNTKDNAFGCFLAGLAGEDDPLEPPGEKWTNAGCVYGPKRTVAWRVLDAQYFGVAQRRRRVFVVASARDDFDPVSVLFELEGVRRDTAPSREARKETTGTISSCTTGGGGLGTDFDCDGGVITMAHGQGGAEIAVDRSPLTCIHEVPIEAYGIQGSMIGRSDNAGPQGDGVNKEVCFTQNTTDRHAVAYGIPGNWIGRAPENGGNATEPMHDVSPCLTKTDRHGVAQPISWDEELNPSVDIAGTLIKGGDGGRHAGVATPITFDGTVDGPVPPLMARSSRGGAQTLSPGHQTDGHMVAQPITFGAQMPHPQTDVDMVQTMQAKNPMAFAQNTRDEVRYINGDGAIAGALAAESGMKQTNYVQQHMVVRRLTPVECERLQGFPDGYTSIPWRNKPANECPDGPRYKALGNSWAVPVVRWIGRRIHNAVVTGSPICN